MNRKILHVDMDAFFASVEQLDHPELRGKPVIVGGYSDRGVVATCSYEARVFGVRSAMPSFKAKQLCPEGIFVRGNMERYAEVSRAVFAILEDVTDKIEKVSIDEAYLDVSDLYHSPEFIGNYIKDRVKKELGLNISVGISYNKFLAKLASDWDKPDGFFIITGDMVPGILEPLDIGKVHGLGKKSVDKLNNIGIFTIGDLLQYSRETLKDIMGAMGDEVYDRIRGRDERQVETYHERKSIGTEVTLSEDVDDQGVLQKYIMDFTEKLVADLDRKGMMVKTVTIKIKFEDFESITRSKTMEQYTRSGDLIEIVALDIFKSIDLNKKVRLIGLSLSNIKWEDSEQLNLFDQL